MPTKSKTKQAKASGGFSVRPLRAADLDSVIAIDRSNTGVSRRGYFEKRLAASVEHPADYVYSGICAGQRLIGFALAHLEAGEFGRSGAVAALDAIGVDPAAQGQGAGFQLLTAVTEVLAHKKVGALITQVDWAHRALLEFLGAAGFWLDGRIVLVRTTEGLPPDYPDAAPDTPREIDHSAPQSDDFIALSHDRIPVRSMTSGDLDAIIAIDRRHSGQSRAAYYRRRLDEALNRSGIRVSLIAELDGAAAGFIMARVDYGEYGQTVDEAVMDSIGVDPGFRGKGVGRALMSQLMANLSVLRVATLRTETDWNAVDLIAYLDATGFVPAQRITLRRSL